MASYSLRMETKTDPGDCSDEPTEVDIAYGHGFYLSVASSGLVHTQKQPIHKVDSLACYSRHPM